MRLIEEEKDIIVAAIQKYDCEAEILLFGSRVDDNQKGGDVDILILSNTITPHEIILIGNDIFSVIEEQKIDLVISPKDKKNSFADMILEERVINLCPKKS